MTATARTRSKSTPSLHVGDALICSRFGWPTWILPRPISFSKPCASAWHTPFWATQPNRPIIVQPLSIGSPNITVGPSRRNGSVSCPVWSKASPLCSTPSRNPATKSSSNLPSITCSVSRSRAPAARWSTIRCVCATTDNTKWILTNWLRWPTVARSSSCAILTIREGAVGSGPRSNVWPSSVRRATFWWSATKSMPIWPCLVRAIAPSPRWPSVRRRTASPSARPPRRSISPAWSAPTPSCPTPVCANAFSVGCGRVS